MTYNNSTWTDSTWLAVSNKEAFEEVKANALKAIKETKIYSSSANVTAVKEAVSESLDNVYGIDSYEITSIKSYTPAQLGKEGNFAGSVKIVCSFDESLSATLDFDVTIPAITQTADEQLAQINEAVKKAVADYASKLDGKPEIKVSWNDDDAFKLTPATSDAAGKIVGTLDITYNGTTVTTKVDLDISKLPAPSIKVEKVAVSDKFTATSSVVRINWTALKDVDGYRVYRLDPVSGKYKVVKTLHDGSLNTFRITGLDSATEYTFAVKAFVNDEDGAAHYGPVSDAIKTATDPLATQVTKSSSSKSAVRLYYKESKGADGYKIQKYNTSTKKWETVKITSKTNYKVKGLNSKTSYKFRVQAFKRTSGKKLYSAWSTAYTAKTK